MGKYTRRRNGSSKKNNRVSRTVQQLVDNMESAVENSNFIQEEIDGCKVTTVFTKDAVTYMIEGEKKARESYIKRLTKDFNIEGYGSKPKIKGNVADTVIFQRRSFGEFTQKEENVATNANDSTT